MKLYGIYNVISNKGIRAHENFYKKYRKKNKKVQGQLVRTNRGFFIDGKEVDQKAVTLWHNINNQRVEQK